MSKLARTVAMLLTLCLISTVPLSQATADPAAEPPPEPTNSKPRVQPTTQKGVAVTRTSDAEEVGAQHAAITLAANYLMRTGPGDNPDETIAFEHDGKTYYADQEYVRWLDHMIKPLSDDDMLVYLVLVLVYEEDPDSSFHVLAHPDAPKGPPPGFMTYAFNTVTDEGIGYYSAFMDFISERYTRDDEAHGRALDYVVGNEIDSAGIWQQMGDKTLPEFIDAYEPALRLAHEAVSRHHAETRVYTSLDHFWNTTADPSQPLQFYKGREVLDQLAAKIKEGGDFPWNVAFHPYPADMLSPEVWNDDVTDDPGTTPKITYKNIAALPDYLQRPEMQYGGKQRHIILSEQACQSPTNGDVDQKLQAACFAYAYYKILAAGGIDAFIWDPQVDNKAAGGLRMGLWTWDEDRPDFPAAPGEKKLIYDLFRDIDTPESLKLTEFAKSIIGIDEWTDAIPNFTPDMIDKRTIVQQAGASSFTDLVRPHRLSGFEDGVDGWRPSDHVHDVSAVEDASAAEGRNILRADFREDIIQANGTNSKTWRGVDLPFTRPLNALARPHLGMQLRVKDKLAERNHLSAQLRVYGQDGTVASGTVALSPGDEWNSVQIDLSDWPGRDRIERIKVWVKGTVGDDWHGTFELDDVNLAKTAVTENSAPNLEITAKGAEAGGSGSSVTFDVTNHGVEPLPDDLTVKDCDGVTLTSGSLDVSGLPAAGGHKAVSGTFDTYTPADPEHPRICFTLSGHTYDVPVVMPPPPPNLIFDFEDGVQGWAAGENTASVEQVSSFPNGPQRPHGGDYALDAIMKDGDASQPKTVSARLDEPLDLSEATTVYAWANAYGGIPDATGYEATFTLHSGDESISQTLATFNPDSWNQLIIDVTGWEFRSAVTGMDVTYRALGTQFDWQDGPHFQVDDVGWEKGGGPAPERSWNAAWGAPLGGHFGGEAGDNSLPETTYRQTLKLSAAGKAVRVRFVNPFASETLVFDQSTVGIRDGATAGTKDAPIRLTVARRERIEVGPGEVVYSDAVALRTAPSTKTELVISTYAESALPLLSHDWALNTQYRSEGGAGDHTKDTSGDAFSASAMSTYWIDAVDVLDADVAGTVVVLGDSITDGAGADLDQDNRWTDVLARRFEELPASDPRRRTVVNAGIGGNTLASAGNPQVGVNGLERLERDVLSQSGVSDVIVFEGTNDLYVGAGVDATITALTEAAERIQAAGARATLATIIPRGNGVGWTDELEQQRLDVNAWIRTNDVYDGVIDFDPILDDPELPGRMLPAYDADGTHPNAAGYAVMGAAVDLSLYASPAALKR